MKSIRILPLISLFAVLLCTSVAALAQGDLMITPRRVVFDGGSRTMNLNLANIGEDTATYAVSMVQIRMKESGAFETITEPDEGQHFADKNLRFYPRTVTLAPNEAQTVKVQLVRASQLEQGEYRSHIYFRSIPKQTAMGEEEVEVDTTGISVRLIPIFGITIPAIIRVGESTTEVSLSNLDLETPNDSTQILNMQLNRSGNFSVYGDLKVDYISEAGEVTRVGIANGVAVYTPNALRRFQLNLRSTEEIDFHKGHLKVAYTSNSDAKPETYDEAELMLN